MEMRSGGIARVAGKGYNLSALNVLTGGYEKLGIVRIKRGISAAVVNKHVIAVGCMVGCNNDRTGICG